MPDEVGRYVQAARLLKLREMLETEPRVTLSVIAKRFDAGRTTAARLIEALREGGHDVVEEREGRELVFRLASSTRRGSVAVTLRQLFAFELVRKHASFLVGTGFDADLDELAKRLRAEIADASLLTRRRLDQKIAFVPYGSPRYAGSADKMNQVFEALFHEEELDFTTEKRRLGRRNFRVEPLTIEAHRDMLYLVAKSQAHEGAVRTFGFHTIVDASRRVGVKFEYPDDYDPRGLVDGVFGLVRGKLESVCVRFAEPVVHLVVRKVWHESQSITYLDDGSIEFRMHVRGMDDVREWVLGFGEHAEVLAPRSLREEIARIAKTLWRKHRTPASSRRPE